MDSRHHTQILFMATCLCDTFFADVARAAVEVLEYAGCDVLFPEDQTCCGQPAFNSGDFVNGRKVARHTCRVFDGDLPVVVPSGSCTAMLKHGNSIQFEDEPDGEVMTRLGNRTWEICDFLVNKLNFNWDGHLPGTRVTMHHSCHSRGSRTGDSALKLLNGVDGLDVRVVGQADQCCGFGGTFSVAFPHISAGMGNLKLSEVEKQSPDYLVSADMSCLMHLSGLAEKSGTALPVRHVVQILRDSMVS